MFYNADSGLYLTQYRAYDPVAGRWLSRDPIGESSDPAANLYRYVNGNPVSLIDPDGRFGLAGAAVGAVVGGAVGGLGDLGLQLIRNGGNFRCLNLGEAGAAAGLGAGIGALLGGTFGIAAVAETTLYRAIGPAELVDIQTTGVLRNLGSAEGKYFTTSAEAAASYAKQAVRAFGDPPYTIVRTTVPNKIFEGLTSAPVDRGIQAWVIPSNRLPGLAPQVLDTMPIPHL
jgi:RHS repeat-associated protein